MTADLVRHPTAYSKTQWSEYLTKGPPVAPKPERVISFSELFCGPGGLALGARCAATALNAEPTFVGAIDHDPGAVCVYEVNQRPEFTTVASVSTLADYRVVGEGPDARFRYEPEIVDEQWATAIGRTDVLLAGPPCQGHSNLNNRSRRVDPRNELYLSVPAIAAALQAEHVIIENVPSVLNDSRAVVESAATLLRDAGYLIEAGVIKGETLGWPQSRSRYFMIASRSQAPFPLDDLIQEMRIEKGLDVMWALEELANVPADDHMFREPELSPANRERIDWLFDNDAYDLALDQRPDCHQDGTTYTAVYGRMHPDRPAPTITTGFMTPGRGRFVHPMRRRALRPAEAARLQGFPDNYVFDPEGPPTAAKLVKWIGDAVPMPLGQTAVLSAILPAAS